MGCFTCDHELRVSARLSGKIPGSGGFTLLQLIASLVIITLLALVAGQSFKHWRLHSERVLALSNLRQVGMAVHQYAADNHGRLPGPLWIGQGAVYSQYSDRNLGYYLWEYLEAPPPPPQEVEFEMLANPAYPRLGLGIRVPAYIMNGHLPTPEGDRFNPWGYRHYGEAEGTPPMPIARVSSAGLSDQWMIRDIDKTLGVGREADWFESLADEPVFGNQRVALYFDLSARLLPVEH